MHLINYDIFKTFLQTDADQKLAETIIESISGRIEHYLNRELVEQQRTKRLDVRDGKTKYSLPAFPFNSAVYSMTIINNGTTLTENTDFFLHDNNGLIELQYALTRYQPLQMVVTWVGGYTSTIETSSIGTSITVVTGAPVDLQHACTLQSIFTYRKRDSIGVSSMSMPDGSVATTIAIPNMLPEVKAILGMYKRRPA